MPRFLVAVGAVFVFGAAAHAQDGGLLKLTLHPAPLPAPALKYRLLPDLRTQTAGNAVPLYEDAIGKLKPLERDPDERQNWQERFPQWSEMPVKELPRDEVRKALEPYKDILDLAEKAARRDYCDWDLRARLRKGGLRTLLPEVQFMRTFAILLSVRARLEMADGNLTAAEHTIQTGLALAKQTAEQPTLINYLVGAAIAQIVLRQLDDFVQQPKAPNLYWALTDLPPSLIEQRKPFEGERLWVYGMFPGIGESIADLDAGPITEEQVQSCVKELLNRGARNVLIDARRKLEISTYVSGHYEASKKVLLDQGRSKEKVDKMPHLQVVLMAEVTDYEEMMDDQIKWTNEPYYKVADRLDKAAKALKEGSKKSIILPEESLGFLVPAIGKIFQARVRLQRKLDALRCVEAIRAYAAGHDGKLPASLDDIKDVPIPLDPVTGKAFTYIVNGDKATLAAPAVRRENKTAFDEVAYEITLER
jgi:hypothetical protein